MDTVNIKLGVFVQHLLKVREAGPRKPDSYALGAIAPRPTEGGREPMPYPPGTTPPLTRYVPEGQAGEIIEALGYDVMTPRKSGPSLRGEQGRLTSSIWQTR